MDKTAISPNLLLILGLVEMVNSSVCVQLTAAPDFRDPELENTYWYHRGAWDTTFEHSALVQEGIERIRFFRAVANQEQDLPLIVVESSTGDHALGLVFRDATGVGGNHQMSTACLHSDGDSYDIEPGRNATREGLLIIHPEGKEGVLKIAKAFFNEEKK